MEEFNVTKLDQAMNKYCQNTKGSDHWTKAETAALPNIAKFGIVEAYNTARKCLVTLHQNLSNLLALVGKLCGGPRTICKTPMFYCIIRRIDTGVEKWDTHNSAAYDTCGEGKSALFAALIRNLTGEVATLLGQHSAVVFLRFPKAL